MATNSAELAAAAAAPASPAQAEQEQQQASLAPTTLAGRCAILRRELGLSDMTVAETVHVAATQLGIDHTSGGQKTLGEIAALCVNAIGVGIGVEPDQPPGPSLAGHQPGPSLRPQQQEELKQQRQQQKGRTAVVAWLDAVKAAGGYTGWQQLTPQQQEELKQHAQQRLNKCGCCVVQ